MRCLLALCLLAPAVAAAPVPKGTAKGSWVGKLAFAKDKDVKVHAVQPDGAEQVNAVGSATLGYPVTKVTDDRVEVGGFGQGQTTYFRRDDVLRAKEAIDHYTAKLSENAKDATYLASRAMAYQEEDKYDQADADFSEALKAQPNSVWLRQSRIALRVKAKKFDAALEDHDEIIKANPTYEYYKVQRATTLAAAKRYDEAIEALTKLLENTRIRNSILLSRGLVYTQAGKYDKALADYDDIIQADPQNALGYNNKAWLLAICPDAKHRDGKKAVELATKACEMTNWKNAGHLDTLAAAYAEAGDFEKAVKWQSEAVEDVELMRREGAEMKERLELFKQKKPYRLPVEKLEAKPETKKEKK